MTRIVVFILLAVLPTTLLAELPSYREFRKMIHTLVSETMIDGTPQQKFREMTLRRDDIKYWKSPDDYKQIPRRRDVLEARYPDNLLNWNTEDEAAATISSSIDFIWPEYYIEDHVLNYRLGGLIAFELRDPRPTDVAVKAQYLIELHRQVNQIEWRENEFWTPVLDRAEEYAEEIYNRSIIAESADSQLDQEQHERFNQLTEIFVDALKRRAEEFDLKRVKPIPEIKYPRRFLLKQSPDFAKEIHDLWHVMEYEMQLADYVDVRLRQLNANWPEPEWTKPPVRAIPGRGSYLSRAVIDPNLVPEPIVEIAKGRKPTREERSEFGLKPIGSGFNYFKQMHCKAMLDPASYIGNRMTFRYGVSVQTTGFHRSAPKGIVYLRF